MGSTCTCGKVSRAQGLSPQLRSHRAVIALTVPGGQVRRARVSSGRGSTPESAWLGPQAQELRQEVAWLKERDVAQQLYGGDAGKAAQVAARRTAQNRYKPDPEFPDDPAERRCRGALPPAPR